jgi:exodeoxyribonuclease VII small subunit
MTKQESLNFEQLRQELDTILAELQSEAIDVDAAVAKYERGLTIIKELEQYLDQAENRVRDIRAKFDGKS